MNLSVLLNDCYLKHFKPLYFVFKDLDSISNDEINNLANIIYNINDLSTFAFKIILTCKNESVYKLLKLDKKIKNIVKIHID
jgi:hypothetical protein